MSVCLTSAHVVAVYAGYIETDMAAELAGPGVPKVSPRQVADRTLEGIVNGLNHVRADARTEEFWSVLGDQTERLDKAMQRAWDERPQ